MKDNLEVRRRKGKNQIYGTTKIFFLKNIDIKIVYFKLAERQTKIKFSI